MCARIKIQDSIFFFRPGLLLVQLPAAIGIEIKWLQSTKTETTAPPIR